MTSFAHSQSWAWSQASKAHSCPPRRMVRPGRSLHCAVCLSPLAVLHSVDQTHHRKCSLVLSTPVELASAPASTLRAYSITATCIPRQMPKVRNLVFHGLAARRQSCSNSRANQSLRDQNRVRTSKQAYALEARFLGVGCSAWLTWSDSWMPSVAQALRSKRLVGIQAIHMYLPTMADGHFLFGYSLPQQPGRHSDRSARRNRYEALDNKVIQAPWHAVTRRKYGKMVSTSSRPITARFFKRW